jgi:hypothetical protein
MVGKDTLRVLSLGAGVQSSTVLLMSLCGDLPPLDAAIFADTGWEPGAVYRHLDWLEARCAVAGVPLYRVSAGNIRADVLADGDKRWNAQIPLHVRRADGGRGLVKRQCTQNYKVRPIRRQIRVLMAEAGVKRAVQVLGISLDEFQRMRSPDVRYLDHDYPLVERRMTRADCLGWLARRGFARPPKSACIGCPFRDAAGWRAIKAVPEDWADAVDFDAALRDGRVRLGSPGMWGQTYLHGSLRPLPLVDLSTPQERGQTSFLDECAGVCGV